MGEIAIYVVAAAALASAGTAVASGIRAGEEAQIAAKGEQEAQRDRTDARLIRVRQLRAAQTVSAVAAGVDPTFGSAAVIGEDVEAQARAEEASDRFQTRSRSRLLQSRGRGARRGGFARAGAGLLGGAANVFALRNE